MRLRPMAISVGVQSRKSNRWAYALLLLALVGAAAAWIWTSPPMPKPPLRTDRAVRGAYHLHSDASHDSLVSLDSYAQAAAARNLDFLVLTEHDVQRPHSEVRHGVLLIAQSELNLPFGHMVSLGAPRALTDEERGDVACADRIAGIGGHAIVAHPTSKRCPWVGPLARIDGIEVQNAASALENFTGAFWHNALPLAWAYALRPSLALAQLYVRDGQAHAAWDAAPAHVVGLAGIDAHGWLQPHWDLAPWQVVAPTLERPQEMTPAFAEPIIAAMLGGKTYASSGLWDEALDLNLSLHSHEPSASRPATRVLTACAGASDANADGLGAIQVVLLRDGAVVQQSSVPCVELVNPEPGIYRAEVRASMPTLWHGHYEGLLAFSARLVVGPAL